MRNALGMRGKYREWDSVKGANIKTICVIRNPMQRVISSYQYLLKLEDNGFLNQHPVHITKETEFFKHQNDPISSFLMFLDYIEDNGFYDAVTLPQTEFLSDRGVTINDIDEVLIQERLVDDFNIFKGKYGIDAVINNDNTSNNKVSVLLNKHISSNDNIQGRVKKLYKNDFDLYNKLTNE